MFDVIIVLLHLVLCYHLIEDVSKSECVSVSIQVTLHSLMLKEADVR